LQFQKDVEIRAPREKVWNFIWDVDRIISCLPGCKDAKTIEEGKRYSATMVEKVGPFKVEFPTTIEVLEKEELTRIKAQASGADNKIGSRMKVELDVNLKGEGETTFLSFVAGVDIVGKLAALGHGIIKRKADQVLDEFAQAVKQRLEGDSEMLKRFRLEEPESVRSLRIARAFRGERESLRRRHGIALAMKEGLAHYSAWSTSRSSD
jgi:carbon monoxide dehydrogenase subunit G